MAYDDLILGTAANSKILEVSLRDSTTGQLKASVVYGSVTYSYLREGDDANKATGACVNATLDTYTDHGWKETGIAGIYQFGVPQAALATGKNAVTIKLTASGAIDVCKRIIITGANLRLAALPGNLLQVNGAEQTATLDTISAKIGTPLDLGNGITTLAGNLTDIDAEADLILGAINGIGTAGGAAISTDCLIDNYASGSGAVCAVVQGTGVCTPAVDPHWVTNALAGKRILLTATWYSIVSNTGTTCTITGAPANGNYAWGVEGIVGVTIDTPKVGNQTGTFVNTSILDANYHVMTQVSSLLDIVYEFITGGGSQPVTVVWTGYGTPNGRTVTFQAWRHDTGAWETIGSFVTSGTTDAQKNLQLYPRHRGTSTAELGKVYIRIYTASTQASLVLSTNQIYVNYAITSQITQGKVYINTDTGIDGYDTGYNGIAGHPVKTIACALALCVATGIKDIEVATGSSITLGASVAGYNFRGQLWNLALGTGSLSIAAAYFYGANVSGTENTSTGVDAWFDHCVIGIAKIPQAFFESCFFIGAFTTVTGGNYSIVNCFDGIPGEVNPVFVLTANTVLGIRSWSGGINLTTLARTNVVVLDGRGKLILDSNCDHGEIRLRGNWDVTDSVNGGFAGTFTKTANINTSSPMTVGDKTGFSLSATGLDLILHGATFCVALATAVWELGTRTLSAFSFTPKVDVDTIKTKGITCADAITVLANVGFAAAPGLESGPPTVAAGGIKLAQTVDLTSGQSIACSDKAGFSLSATGADLILKSSIFVTAITAAINELATYGLTALNTLLVSTGIKATSVPAVTLANGAHGGAAATIVLQTPIAATVPDDQKVDVNTIKAKTITCADNITVLANVGFAGAPGENNGSPTTDGSKLKQTVDLTTGQTVAATVAGNVGGIEDVTFPTNFGDLAITETTGMVTYSNAPPTVTVDTGAIANAVWDEAIADHTTNTTFGGKNQRVVPSETIGDYKATGFATPQDVTDAVSAMEDYGDSNWTTATGFATSTNITDAVTDIEDYGDLNWKTATGFATPTDVTDSVNSAIEDLGLSAEGIREEIDTNSTQLTAILADTNELQTNQGDWLTAKGFAITKDVTDAVSAIETYGDTKWLTALGFAIPKDVTDAVSAIEDYGDGNWVSEDPPDADNIADTVWKKKLADYTDKTTFGGFIKRILTVVKFLGLK